MLADVEKEFECLITEIKGNEVVVIGESDEDSMEFIFKLENLTRCKRAALELQDVFIWTFYKNKGSDIKFLDLGVWTEEDVKRFEQQAQEWANLFNEESND